MWRYRVWILPYACNKKFIYLIDFGYNFVWERTLSIFNKYIWSVVCLGYLDLSCELQYSCLLNVHSKYLFKCVNCGYIIKICKKEFVVFHYLCREILIKPTYTKYFNENYSNHGRQVWNFWFYTWLEVKKKIL